VDLAGTVAPADIALQEATKEHDGRRGLVAGFHDVFMPLQSTLLALHPQHGFPVIRREVSDAQKMSKQGAADHGSPRCGQADRQLKERNKQPDMNTPRTAEA
jgi:hypothetical protein